MTKTPSKRRAKKISTSEAGSDSEELQLFSRQLIKTVEPARDQQPASLALKTDEKDVAKAEAIPLQKPALSRVAQQREHRETIASLLKQIRQACDSTRDQIKLLRKRVEDGQLPTENGVSFLEVGTDSSKLLLSISKT